MNFIKNLKISQKIMGFVILSSVCILVVGGIGLFYNIKAQQETRDLYNNRALPMAWLNQMNTMVVDNKSLMLSMILSSKENDQAAVEEDIVGISKNAKDFLVILKDYKATNLDPYEVENLKIYESSLVAIKDKRTLIIDYSRQGNFDEAYSVYKEIVAPYESFLDSGKKLAQYNTDVAEKIANQVDANSKTAIILISAILISATILSLFIGLSLSRMIARRLINLNNYALKVADGDFSDVLRITSNDEIGETGKALNNIASSLKAVVKEIIKNAEDVSAGSEELSASANQSAEGAQQVAISVQQLAAGASQVSQSVEDGARSLEQINMVIQGISAEAKVVAKLGNATEDNANTGKKSIEKAVDKIYNIKNASEATSVTISQLGKLSEEIEQIVDLIKGIAGQTNLLALNAAIEAARAGEHGKGFAVVAEEVKKLAGQSASATDKITTMIKEIQNKTSLAVTSMDKGVHEVEEGVVIINEAGTALEEIIKEVKETNNKIQIITKEIDKAAEDSDGVVKMIENIAAVTEETSASAEEISSITEEQTASTEEIDASSQALAKIAENLQKQVAVFRI